MAKRKLENCETMWCDECKLYGNRCEMRVIDSSPFDLDLLEIFPNAPYAALEMLKYAEPKIKALPVEGLKETILPVISNSYKYEEDTAIFPFIGYNIKGKAYKDIHSLYKPNTKVGLLMSGKDEFLTETLNNPLWVEKITARKFDFVLSPNISFYYNQPSCSTVLNRLTSYKAIVELINAGVPVIPSANFLWDSDLERFTNWLNDCEFQYVYFNMQQSKYDSIFESAIEYLNKLNKKFNGTVIVLGVFDPDRIKILSKIGDFKYISSQLNMLSIQRVVWKAGKEEKKNSLDAMFYDDLMNENIINYRKFVTKLIR